MRPFILAPCLCGAPALVAQSVDINLSKKASVAALSLVDGTGAFLAKEIPAFSLTKVFLGKVDPEKSGGVRLARLITTEGKPLLKAKIVFSLSIDDDCDPFKGTDHPKAKPDADGVWVLELPKALEPGTYALVSATGSKGMFGVKVEAKARIFQVPSPGPALAAATAH